MRIKHTYIKEQVFDRYVCLETNANLYKLNLGFTGLAGVLFLITYSYISHFFFPHGNLHNLQEDYNGLFQGYFFGK